jgi:uncharacterized membrane protein YqiK
MFFWRVPAPNEALLISGSKRRKQGTEFRIVTGHGSFVFPVKQKARILSLALREAEITEDCITNQGVRLSVRAVAAFKVGDDSASIANAARRFLSEQDRMEVLVGRIFAGHLRSIIGGLTVEQIIRERDRVFAARGQPGADRRSVHPRPSISIARTPRTGDAECATVRG